MDFGRKMARGQSEATPARALGAVFVVVFAVVAVVVGAALLIYLLL
jgi:hypothetical protein